MRSDLKELLISPVTGHIFCTYNYLLGGNAQGIAVPMVAPIGILPDLTLNKTWAGDPSNRPVEQNYIGDSTFLIREPNSLLPSAQDLKTLSLTGTGLIKVVSGGYIELAIPLIDYATQAFAVALIIVAEANVLSAVASAAAAFASAAIAAPAAIAAAGSAVDAALSTTAAGTSAGVADAEKNLAASRYNDLLGVGLNDLPNYGDIDVQGYRVKNISPVPIEENDLISFQCLWELLNNRLEVTL